MEPQRCQLYDVLALAGKSKERIAHHRLKYAIKRRLTATQRMRVARWRNHLYERLGLKSQTTALAVPTSAPARLAAGDRVRVLNLDRIEATLNTSRQFKGCSFMREMIPYCGTEQHVLKAVTRFVDERDFRIKNAKGIVLLDGVMCQGTADFGRCDRSCFYFWREEWLEKLD